MITRERVEAVLDGSGRFCRPTAATSSWSTVERQLGRRAADRHVRRLPERAHDAASSASRRRCARRFPEFETLRLV